MLMMLGGRWRVGRPAPDAHDARGWPATQRDGWRLMLMMLAAGGWDGQRLMLMMLGGVRPRSETGTG